MATLAGIAPPYLMDQGFATMTADNAAKYAAATSRAGLSSLEASYTQLADGVQGEPSHLLQYLEPDLRPADRAVLAAANLRWLTRLGHRDGFTPPGHGETLHREIAKMYLYGMTK